MFLDWTENLRDRLSQPLPGPEAWMKMAPSSRNLKLPDSETLQKANKGAVLILFYPIANEPHLVLMKRPDYPGVHSGQISFPGGKIEPEDENEAFAALREAEEETGISANGIELLGKLTELYIPPSNFLVHPYVGRVSSRPDFRPDPVEVAGLIEVPLRHFFDAANRKEGKIQARQGMMIHAPYFDVSGNIVWGATAIMLSELTEAVKDFSR